jgi:hypothetical protein
MLLAVVAALFFLLRSHRSVPDNSRAISTAAEEAEVRGAEAAAAEYRRAQ